MAAQWVAADACIVVEEEVADIIMVNVELCAADDLVGCPVGECSVAVGPQHYSCG